MLHSISALIDGEKRTGNYICLDAKYLRGKSYGEQMNAGRFIHSGDNIILVDGVSFPKRVDSQMLVTLSGWVCSSHLQTSSGVECFATLRVPFPLPLAAGALANDLKLTALQEFLLLRDLDRWPTSRRACKNPSLRDFVAPEALRHPSPPAAGLCKAQKNKSAFKQA